MKLMAVCRVQIGQSGKSDVPLPFSLAVAWPAYGQLYVYSVGTAVQWCR